MEKPQSSPRTETWQEAREIFACHVLVLFFTLLFLLVNVAWEPWSNWRLVSFSWTTFKNIMKSECTFSIHFPGLEQLTNACHSKQKYVCLHINPNILANIWPINWSVNSTCKCSSVLDNSGNSSYYGSKLGFMLTLMICTLCNMTVNSIIEGMGLYWETLQWLADVNRKLILADECRRSHRKFRLPGVLDGWVSLPYLLFLSLSFFQSLF